MRIRGRAAIIWLLTGLNVLNYLDRYVVAAVSPRIQEALQLSDFQVGWVLSIFMLGYFLTSPVFGVLGDVFPRKGLIAVGVMLWSLTTVASGLAGGFITLLGVRLLVGVGEASYATISPTIIDDLSEAQTKNKWLAVFYAAIPVGSALGFALGGQLEHLWGWRSAFFIAGAPGLLLAFLVLTIEEPARLRPVGTKVFSPFSRMVRIPLYCSSVAGYTAYTFALGGFAAWAPKYLYTVLQMELHKADIWFGTLLAVAGFLGTALGGFLGDRWPGKNRARAYLQVCALVSAIAVPLATVSLLTWSPVVFFVTIGLCEFFLFTASAPINAAILRAVPEELRASAMAASIFAIHLFGDLLSPPFVGKISDILKSIGHEDATSLRTAMFTLPAAIALGAAIWWWGSVERVSADSSVRETK